MSRGANATIAKLRGGGEDYINTSNTRNVIELTDFLKLGGLGHAPPGKFLTTSGIGLLLVANFAN